MRRVAAACFALAALTYATWLAGSFLVPQLSITASYASELGADGVPYAGVFRLADAVTGVLLVVGAAALGTQHSTWVRALLALWGASTLVDAIFPMTCAQSIDVACVLRGATFPTVQDSIHVVSSAIATVAALAAVVAGSWGRHAAPATRAIGWVCLVASASLAVVSIVMEASHVNIALGVIQRLQLATLSLWLIMFAVQIASRTSRDWGAPEPTHSR